MFTITRLDDDREPDITAANVDEVVDALEGRRGVFQITYKGRRAVVAMEGQSGGDKFVVELFRMVEALTANADDE